MRIAAYFVFVCIVSAAAVLSGLRASGAAEVRFALVIGNDSYKAATLATPANDAGLIAEALQSAGFAVSGARNLDQDTLRRSFREFLDQVSAAGPDAVALVYLAGQGLQFEGENYFVPIDADIKRDVDIPIQAIRVSDFTRPLAALPGRVKIVILDAARQSPFAAGGQPLASGLALVDPEPGSAIAFNAAPGSVGPNEPGPYGAFATALSEMIRTGGLGLDELFARVRLRVDETTQGAEVPWFASHIDGPFEFTVREAGAPPLPTAVSFADVRSKPMRSYPVVEDAYAAAVERDTLEGYQEFLTAYPDSPYGRRIDLMLAARREAMIWRRCVREDSPPAYWSYLRRYPDGPHAFDARRRLRFLSAAMEPPPSFALMEFGVPPPPPQELRYFNRRVIVFGGPDFGPPPPPPMRFLPPRPREFTALPPPQPPRAAFVLPTPAAVALPLHVRPPAAVAAPAQPIHPATPGAAPAVPVSLPAAVHATTSPSAPGGPASATPGLAPAPLPPGAARPSGPPAAAPPGPPSAAVKPAPLPSPGTPPAATAVKPAPLPPHPAPLGPAAVKPAPLPSPGTPPAAAAVKPAPLPPHPAPPGPAAVKPAPLPPHPAPPGPAAVKPAPLPSPGTPPAAAAVKPAPPPPHPAPPGPAALKPAPLPPHPAPPGPAAVKPAPLPPHPAPPGPAAVKPAPLPPHPAPPMPAAVKPVPPPPRPAAPAPVVAKPAPPPPHPAAPTPAAAPPKPPARPACPPGKTAAVENGHPVCK